jgi:5-methylthioadenosine/S-adenosylhomocysteine deaminase
MLIAEATLFTIDPNNQIIDPAWVRVRDGVIEEVSAIQLQPLDGEEVIDAKKRIVMPGFVNTHTHLFQTLLRGVYEERPLAIYLDYIYRSGLELTPEDSKISAMLGSIEQIRSGSTTLVDHHFLNRIEALAEGTIDGMREIGVRAVLARTVMDMGDTLPSAILERPEDGLRAVQNLLKRYEADRKARLVTIMTGPNTPGVNASDEAVVATSAFARKHGICCSAHVAEYKGAVESVRRKYGYGGVVEWLNHLGVLGPDFLAVHAVQVGPEEIAHFSHTHTPVSHNPFSNLFCGDRNAPVSEYLKAGMTVGFGTDGGANNNAQGVLDALRITRLLQRTHPADPTSITPEQALRMATIDGARSIGLGDIIGSVELGKQADLIFIDFEEAAHTVPTHDVLVQLVHSIKGTDVRSAMVDGRFILRDREVMTANENAVLKAAAKAGHDLVHRLG